MTKTPEKEEINIFPVYTLQRSVLMRAQNLTDKTLYLHANGTPQICPFMTKGKEAILCGTHCAKFDIVPVVNEKNEPLGPVMGIQSCGTARRINLSNLKLNTPVEKDNGSIEAKKEGNIIPLRPA